MTRSILVLLVMSACATATPQESYTFRSKWPVSSGALWKTAIAATEAHYRIARVDPQNAVFVTAPEPLTADAIPRAAREHRDDLLGDIRERAWRSGVVH